MSDDVKGFYVASNALTISLGTLATSATGVAGRESTAISNATNLYWDYFVGGKIVVGNSISTAGTVELWACGAVNNTPLYPDTVTGSDAAITFTSRDHLTSALRFLGEVKNSTTIALSYWFAPISIREVFGFVPTHFNLVVINRSTGLLAASGSALYATGVYLNQG